MDGGILSGAGEIALSVKIAYTLFLCLLVPVYLRSYGATNFLWFSDIALVTTAFALWWESPLLASMMAVGVMLPELAWNMSFFARLLFGVRVVGLADYMFEPDKPKLLRGLSLFHVALPLVLLWMLDRLGYDERAWKAQSLLASIVLPATYLLTDPAQNMNWVFGPGAKPQKRLPPWLYLLLVMLLFPLAVYLPTHWMLSLLFDVPPR